MKKILLNISLALALGFSIISCNDWLDILYISKQIRTIW